MANLGWQLLVVMAARTSPRGHPWILPQRRRFGSQLPLTVRCNVLGVLAGAVAPAVDDPSVLQPCRECRQHAPSCDGERHPEHRQKYTWVEPPYRDEAATGGPPRRRNLHQPEVPAGSQPASSERVAACLPPMSLGPAGPVGVIAALAGGLEFSDGL
jgi:hypothetical protein